MNNPFILPDGNVLISFSGGRTSAFMLHEILCANGSLPDRAKVVFANTGREMPETLDFVQDCSERWSVPIVWVEYTRPENKVGYKTVNHNSASRDGEPFDCLIDFRQTLPNVAWRYCTIDLKVNTIKRYLVQSGWKTWVNTVGIRADEKHRVKPSQDRRWTNWFPLSAANIAKSDVHDFWYNQPFDLRVVKGGGNCDGCFLKSEATLASMWRNYPKRMQWWADAEAKIGTQFHKTRSCAGLKDFVQRQSDWIYDDQNFLCQVDDGECTG
ncbi:MAG: hypothetical protein EBT12_14575 [Marivivens sp.]|nr:hypothetical protein [Marivivens sp.]